MKIQWVKLNINLDIISLIETHIKESVPCPINIQLPSYFIEHTSIGALRGIVLLYINNRSYKPRTNPKMYAPGKLESVLEIICPKTTNLIIA